MHHLAIATNNLAQMVDFYSTLPGLSPIRENFHSDGRLRSVWFSMGDSSTILMLEEEDFCRGCFALVFDQKGTGFTRDKLEIFLSEKLSTPIIHSTESTIYFQDPDGNRLGYSDYVFSVSKN